MNIAKLAAGPLNHGGSHFLWSLTLIKPLSPKSINIPAPGGGENAMRSEGFPRPVAVALGIAVATALSLLTAFAFGGFPLP